MRYYVTKTLIKLIFSSKIMMKILYKNVIFGLLAVLITIFIWGTIPTEAANPNLDGDSQPTRIKLSECLADVKEVTAWGEKETLDAARETCELRKAHAQQKTRFLTSLKKLQQEYQDSTNHGFDKHLPTAIADSWTIVKSCIDFKEGFTYPHNIALLKVPENVRIRCYSLGADLVESALFNQK
ncbi:hypothetical protein HCG51_34220 (plasmid) [Tolypothrix sp. PCC 7910]|uniref:hypothetical protein n=1 Tax=Tolypothrix sp. PCC 7910 TaxID=2099387 RepID=UPI00142786B2|nr:hypothetical protein [Tolypothrix sp. PCC 7910]QIR41744.1 hypothetical protein HCG51_34220 [Tolypothrix sp. PCC 7910]